MDSLIFHRVLDTEPKAGIPNPHIQAQIKMSTSEIEAVKIIEDCCNSFEFYSKLACQTTPSNIFIMLLKKEGEDDEESPHRLKLIYEDFLGAVECQDLSTQKNKLTIIKLLTEGFVELNSYGYSCRNFSFQNVVKTGSSSFKIIPPYNLTKKIIAGNEGKKELKKLKSMIRYVIGGSILTNNYKEVEKNPGEDVYIEKYIKQTNKLFKSEDHSMVDIEEVIKTLYSRFRRSKKSGKYARTPKAKSGLKKIQTMGSVTDQIGSPFSRIESFTNMTEKIRPRLLNKKRKTKKISLDNYS